MRTESVSSQGMFGGIFEFDVPQFYSFHEVREVLRRVLRPVTVSRLRPYWRRYRGSIVTRYSCRSSMDIPFSLAGMAEEHPNDSAVAPQEMSC